MALYIENRLSSNSEAIFESFEHFILNEDYENYLNNKIKEISSKEAELKKLINEKPKSWLERKLESFQAAIERFEVKHKLTKDNKSKGIIKKILSVLTRIVKWINEKLLQGTRWVGNKFFKREEKLKAHEKKISAMDLDLRSIKANRGLAVNSLDSTKNMIEKAKTNKKGKINDYTFTGKETKEEFDKMMTDKNGRIVFR